jgi:nucleotide-binding universal stress UspA family protein
MGAVDVIRRLREEFTEMPGLRLTKAQVERLCTADGFTSASALRDLVTAGFLTPMADGSYGRTDVVAGSLEVPRPKQHAGTPPSAWRRILCLVELEKEDRGPLSTVAYSALRYATTLGVTHRARITALQVVTPPSPPSLKAVADELRKSVFGQSFRGLIDVYIAVGSVSEELIRVATDIHADLIVLGRGADAGGQSLLRLPEILRRAPCPVLIVHPSGRAAVA